MYRHEKIFRAKVVVAVLLYLLLLSVIMVEMYRDVMTRGRCISIVETTRSLSLDHSDYPRNTDLLIAEIASFYDWAFACRLLQPNYFGHSQILWDADAELHLSQHDRQLAQAGDLLYWSDGHRLHLGYLNRFGAIIRVI